MSEITIYRKRFIPDECICLKGDTVLTVNDDYIVTKWNVLNKKDNFHHGTSCYCLKKGIKVSKFYTENGELYTWYIDIMHYDWSSDHTALTTTDLLADVTISPNGIVKVRDLDEIGDILKQDKLPKEMLIECMYSLHNLLNSIYDGSFQEIQNYLESLE